MDSFAMNAQVEETRDFKMWEDMADYLKKREKNNKIFIRDCQMLGAYREETTEFAFADAVETAWENISPEMKEIAQDYGITSVGTLIVFIRGLMSAID